jgi:Druantia protein DruA
MSAVVLTHHGHVITQDDLDVIRGLLAERSSWTRRSLSIALCERQGWLQPNGAPRDAVCRATLLALHRAGHIELPPPKYVFAEPWRRLRPKPVDVSTEPLESTLRELGPVELQQVRRTAEEQVANGLVEHHHYLGYTTPVGERMKYLITAQGRPIGCFIWSSAPRHLGPRDRHIGWSAEVRRANIRFIAYQTRFLILPWVRVPHLASHLLGRMSRQLSEDWQRVYGHPIHFTETFVDTERNQGTCYRAANWTELGVTTGRGKADLEHRPNRSVKRIFGYPLARDWRERLTKVAS